MEILWNIGWKHLWNTCILGMFCYIEVEIGQNMAKRGEVGKVRCRGASGGPETGKCRIPYIYTRFIGNYAKVNTTYENHKTLNKLKMEHSGNM